LQQRNVAVAGGRLSGNPVISADDPWRLFLSDTGSATADGAAAALVLATSARARLAFDVSSSAMERSRATCALFSA
jgi:hypothetical protein